MSTIADSRPARRQRRVRRTSTHGPDLPAFVVEYRRAIRFMLHVALIPFGYLLAFALRFDFAVPSRYIDSILFTLPILVVVRLASFAMFRVYNGSWRHAGIYDLIELVKALTVGSTLFVAILFLTREFGNMPRSVLVLEWLCALLAFGGARFTVRLVRESHAAAREGKRALIVGADDTAASLIRDLRRDPRSGLIPVGLVDDDPLKQALKLHGISVLGTTADLPRLVRRHAVRLVVVAIAAPARQVMRKIAERCAGLDVELKVVPGLAELLHGTARPGQLRAVEIEELLGRTPVTLGLERIAADVSGRVVLITGGAGSIGSELARQIAMLGPARIVLVEQAESPLYFVHLELARKHPGLAIVPCIADVTDESRMTAIFDEQRPDYVLHAAAYKHVPLMEANVSEAIRNNVLGTLVTARQAARHGVARFVLISTDKAVKPSSVMGATKRAAERVLLGHPALIASRTDFRVVRFGNVLGSEGSVVPLFRQQIAAGGPVTVTDPAVTRYFMTIPEAVQLVLQAAALPEASRRVTMLDMGRPMRIIELAENLIRLSGLEPYAEMPIVFSGLRPGEKLHEDLVSEIDAMVPTTVEKIWLLSAIGEDGAWLPDWLDQIRQALADGTQERLLLALCDAVPECVAPLRERADRAAIGGAPSLLAS